MAGIAAGWLALALPGFACDSTGCLMLTRGPGGLLRKHGFSLDLSYRLIDQSRRLSGGSIVDRVSRPRVDFDRGRLLPGYHDDLEGTNSALQLEAGYGVTRRTNLYASAPLVSLRSHRIGHGTVVTPYDTWGFGDLVIGARQAIPLPFAGNAVASLGLQLPTGRSDLLDPFDAKILDPVLQPGSGSLDVLASAQYSRRLAGPRLDIALSASYQANTTSGRRYRFGNEAIVTLGLARALGRRVVLTAQGKWLHEGRDGFAGLEVPSSGARFVYLTAGLRATAGAFSSYVVAQAPVSSHVNETQLAPRAGLILGFGRTF